MQETYIHRKISYMKTTPIYPWHCENGAKMVDFAGFSMPVQYSGIQEEHRAVRNQAGLFDVSHMGNLLVHGAGARDFLQSITTNNVKKLNPIDVQYSALLYENGTFVDDILVTHLEEGAYHIVINASNIEKVWQWLSSRKPEDVVMENRSEELAIIALQGPKALDIAQPLVTGNLSELGTYKGAHSKVNGVEMVYSRTGYTGEDGIEFFPKNKDALELWNAIMEAGKNHGLIACGLGARDTLRLEAGFSLYGHEINDQVNAVEAGLSWIVDWGEDDFIGKQELLRVKTEKPKRKIVGIALEEKAIPREGYAVESQGAKIGTITSGSVMPGAEFGIAMALVATTHSATGTPVDVVVRDIRKKAKVTGRHFYRRPK